MSDIKVVAFDCFGTVFDFAMVDHQDIADYVRQVKAQNWKPLHLPKSWETMKAHPDSAVGIERLRKKFMVVTCSNGSLGLLAKMSKRNRISWDAIIPMELNKVYKPNPRAYMTVCEVLDCKPSDVLMVTANEKFGDLEAARSLGMQSILIRGNDGGPRTIIDLAEQLGCPRLD